MSKYTGEWAYTIHERERCFWTAIRCSGVEAFAGGRQHEDGNYPIFAMAKGKRADFSVCLCYSA